MTRNLRSLAALTLACLALGPGQASAAPVEPLAGSVYMVGTEFTAPCQNDPWPWNTGSTVGAGFASTYDEVNEYTVLAFDQDHDGFDYDQGVSSTDDRLFYIGGPQVSFGYYDWADAYDTPDCWRRHMPPLTVPQSPPLPDYQSGDDHTGPGGEEPPQPNPRPDDPVIAEVGAVDGGGFLGVSSVEGTWRWERWRQTAHWYYMGDPEESPNECLEGAESDRNKHCWANQNLDPEKPDNEYALLDRRDFMVSEPVVFITSGPTGKVGSRAATFEFVWVSDDEDEGHFECAIDTGAFQNCESPKTYTGLEDGPHKFEVRYVLTGQDPDDATITERQWTVDTTPPDTIIQSAPSGTVSSGSATIEFISSEPDSATYRCRLDGGAEYDCSSPERLSGLGEGTHTFEVKSIDRVGNAQSGFTSRSWTVAFPPPGPDGGGGGDGSGGSGPGTVAPPPASSGCETGKVEAGLITAVARSGACFTEKKISETRTRYTTRGQHTINGVLVTPGPLTDVHIDVDLTKTKIDFNGPVKFGLGPLELPVQSGFEREFNRRAESASYSLPFASSAQKKLFGLAGLPLAVAPTFELGTDKGGSSKAKIVVEAPSAIRGVAGGKVDDEAPGGVTAEFGFAASNEEGVKLAAKATIAKAWLFGKVSLEDVSLAVDYPPLAIEGSGTLAFPGATGGGSKFTLAMGWAAEPPGPFFNITKLSLQASNIEKPIGYGFYAQRLGGEFTRCKDEKGDGIGGQISANAGVSYGPEFDLEPIWKGEALSLDGKLALTLCEPKSVEVTGDAKLVGIPLANSSLKYQFDGMAKFKGLIDIAVGPFGYKVGIADAWMTQKAFSAEGTGQLQIGSSLSVRADGVFSSTGMGVCYGAFGRRVGFTQRWGQKPNTFSDGCDVGGLKLSASQAGAAQSFAVPSGAKVHVAVARADAGVPAVTLTGPGGQTIAAPADGSALETPSALVVPDPEAHAVYFVLYSPAAGTWTATGAEPFRIETAAGLPAPRVKAKVTGSGARRTLSWTLDPLPGQSVTFYERGERTARRLVTTSKRSGRLVFAPDNAPGRKRMIEAEVTQDGVPRVTLPVAKFDAPAFAKPTRVRGLALRAGRVRWKAQRGAARYSLVLRTPDGRTRVLETKRSNVAFRGRRVHVTISAIGADGFAGPVTAQTLALKKKPR